MYKKTSAKMDKRTTKCLIAATVLIVIIVMAPVISNRASAVGVPGRLTIHINSKPSCLAAGQQYYCPAGMTTTATISKAGSTPYVLDVPAAHCDSGAVLCQGEDRSTQVDTGETFVIEGKMGPAPPPVIRGWQWFLEQGTPDIVVRGPPADVGQCAHAHEKCEAKWPDYRGEIVFDVNYQWARKQIESGQIVAVK